jgi:hypothetical protein
MSLMHEEAAVWPTSNPLESVIWADQSSSTESTILASQTRGGFRQEEAHKAYSMEMES